MTKNYDVIIFSLNNEIIAEKVTVNASTPQCAANKAVKIINYARTATCQVYSSKTGRCSGNYMVLPTKKNIYISEREARTLQEMTMSYLILTKGITDIEDDGERESVKKYILPLLEKFNKIYK